VASTSSTERIGTGGTSCKACIRASILYVLACRCRLALNCSENIVVHASLVRAVNLIGLVNLGVWTSPVSLALVAAHITFD
jgi:hypothetical protein